MQRVAVTGLGCISALGWNVPDFWKSLAAGVCGIRPLTLVPPEKLSITIGAEVSGFDPGSHFEPKRLAMLDRFSQFALVAAREAAADSGLDFSGEAAARTAVILGTGVGGKTTDDEAFWKLYGEGNPRVHPTVIPRLMASSATSHVTMEFGITGPAFTVSSACSSAGHAIAQAFFMVRHGLVDTAITGGSEACFTLGTMKGLGGDAGDWRPDTCRPFSRDRKGMVLGEGSAVLVLESFERAQRRGARIYAELAGSGHVSGCRPLDSAE